LPVRFAVADAHHLDFAADRFDGTRCDRTFMHLADPARALAEMVRVTRPGGRVVVFEVDFGTLTVDVPDKRLARLILDAWCDSVRDGWRGRRLPALFRAAGLRDFRLIPHVLTLNYEVGTAIVGANAAERARALGLLRDDEAREWVATLAQLHERGEFFCTLTGFLAVARR
jgi:SAM-dependent methyltransferase